MKKRWLVLLAIVSVLIFVVGGCAPEAAPPVEKPPVEKPPVEKPPVEKPVEKIVWKYASYSSPTSLYASNIEKFWENVAASSEGRFECKRFWSAALVPATEQPDGLRAGMMHSTSLCPAYTPSKFPLYNLGYLPCLFPSTENTYEQNRATLEIINEWLGLPALKAELAQWGATLGTETYPVFYSIIGKSSLKNLEDFDGQKIRAVSGTGELLKKLGVIIVMTTKGEQFGALQKGIVDYVTSDWESIAGRSLLDVAKYYTTGISLGHMPYALMFRTADYESLPQDIKEIFEEEKTNFIDYTSEFYVTEYDSYFVPACEKAGAEITTFPASEDAKLRALAADVCSASIDKLEGQGIPGKEAFNSLQDIIAKHVSGYVPSYL